MLILTLIIDAKTLRTYILTKNIIYLNIRISILVFHNNI